MPGGNLSSPPAGPAAQEGGYPPEGIHVILGAPGALGFINCAWRTDPRPFGISRAGAGCQQFLSGTGGRCLQAQRTRQVTGRKEDSTLHIPLCK